MGARAPAPRLLRLKPEDQPLLQKEPLRQGKFTWVTEAGREERWIVASCGNYTVLWNFRYTALPWQCLTSYFHKCCTVLSCGTYADVLLKQKPTCESDPCDLDQVHELAHVTLTGCMV